MSCKPKRQSECAHPVIIQGWGLCGVCGKDMRKEEEKEATTAKSAAPAVVSMVHSVPELKISMELASHLASLDTARLLSARKLVLLVDLDQTLIHTTTEQVPADLPDTFHFQLPCGQQLPAIKHSAILPWYHTRLRPGTLSFLESITKLYELHICTFGTRSYARTIAGFLDPKGKLFSDRILSRDECLSQNCKTANLKELFPQGDGMVVIIDDREDVWNYAKNLVHVRPYVFFKGVGDLNWVGGEKETRGEERGGGVVGVGAAVPDGKEEKGEPAAVTDGENEKKLLKEAGEDEDEKIDKKEEEKVEVTNSEEEKKDDAAVGIVEEEDKNKDKQEEEEDKEIIVEAKQQSTITLIPSTDDPDDYLKYLEQILRSLHTAFYTLYDQQQQQQRGTNGDSGASPDMKNVVPYVKRKVLKDMSIVFSGVIPTQVPIEERKNTRPYQIAHSLGAVVTERLILEEGDEAPLTTHVIAARLGTAKVNEAKKLGKIHIVNPDWLWACNEQWMRVNEAEFALGSSSKGSAGDGREGGGKKRDVGGWREGLVVNKDRKKEKVDDSRFMDTINPLGFFSNEEIESMGHEVDDELEEDEDTVGGNPMGEGGEELDSSSSSGEDEAETFNEKRPKKRRRRDKLPEEEPSSSSSEEESPSGKLGREEDDDSSSSSTSTSADEEEEIMAMEVEKYLEGGEEDEDTL